MAETTALRFGVGYLERALKSQMVEDLEKHLRERLEPEFKRIVREAAVSAADRVRAHLAVHERVDSGRIDLSVVFDGEELELPKGGNNG